MSESQKPSLVIFLHSHRYDRLYQACSMILTAASMGWRCHLFLFYGALASYIRGEWDDVNVAPGAGAGGVRGTARGSVGTGGSGGAGGIDTPAWAAELQRGFEAANVPSLYEMLEKAREEAGELTVCACSTSCKVLGLDVAAVRRKVDEVVGLHTMMQITEKATHVLYL